MSVSQAVVLEFLLERGGRVKNCDLLNSFRDFINCTDPEERRTNRDLFKTCINNVAVVKLIDGVKYVVVKKKYQELVVVVVKEEERGSGSYTITPQISISTKQELDARISADVLNNNSNRPLSTCCFNNTGNSSMKPQISRSSSSDVAKPQLQMNTPSEADAGISSSRPKSSISLDESFTARVLNVPNNGKLGKSGAVYAVVAVKSPPPPCEKMDKESGRAIHQVHQVLKDNHAVLKQIPSHRLTETAQNPSLRPGSFYRSLRTKRKLSLPTSLPAMTGATKTGAFDAKDPIPLDPREHDWLVKLASGRWSQVYSLFLEDAHLAEKRSFISGFTVLHWAAKKGNSKMLCHILDVSKQGGLEVDVNGKSHDGYTPLHMAAIHGHLSVLSVLVHIYGADCNIRDNSGKKPYHYLSRDVPTEVREMLRDPKVSHQVAEHGGDQNLSDGSKGLITFSKLFQPSVGHRKKARHRPSFHYISDDQDETRKRDCASLNRRELR